MHWRPFREWMPCCNTCWHLLQICESSTVTTICNMTVRTSVVMLMQTCFRFFTQMKLNVMAGDISPWADWTFVLPHTSIWTDRVLAFHLTLPTLADSARFRARHSFGATDSLLGSVCRAFKPACFDVAVSCDLAGRPLWHTYQVTL